MLDLAHLSRRPLFPPGGIELCRQIALLTDMKEGDEVLVVPSGMAVTLEHFVREYGVQGSGVENDSTLLERAEDRLRSIGLLDRVHVQPGEMDGLPFRDRVFDIVIADLGLTARVSPEAAIREIVRVAKPDASVVLVQPVWRAPVESVRRHTLSQYLGCPPLTVAEWKRLMREAGLEGLHTEDWSDEATAFRPQITKPFPDFAEVFTFSEKLGILRRARRRWGLAGVWSALARERKVHKVLTQERILGLELVTGVKRGGGRMAVEGVAVRSVGRADRVAAGADRSAAGGAAADGAAADGAAAAGGSPASGVVEEKRVSDLPLFGDKGEAPK